MEENVELDKFLLFCGTLTWNCVDPVSGLRFAEVPVLFEFMDRVERVPSPELRCGSTFYLILISLSLLWTLYADSAKDRTLLVRCMTAL